MRIIASLHNSRQQNDITVSTNGADKTIVIPGKAEGQGSSVNGGELLFLSLATCFCNDIYREASRRKISIESLEVNVSGEFGKEGDPASNIIYDVKIIAPLHNRKELDDLVQHVDGVAEIHNTLRQGVQVTLRN